MPDETSPSAKVGGRQAAYVARNRQSILEAGKRVLANIGPTATVEQISHEANVTHTTIYKYFPNKEVLFGEALSQVWGEWLSWTLNGQIAGESLSVAVDSARKLFRLNDTHPLLAKILKNGLQNPTFIIQIVSSGAYEDWRRLADQGELSNDDFDARWMLYAYAFAGITTAVYVHETMSAVDADRALGYALGLLGVSPSRATRLVNRPLTLGPL